MRVDKVAQDGRTLICTVFQHRKAPLARPMDTVRLVMLAESALAPLLTAGYTPMITAVDWEHAQMLRNSHDRPDPHDPIGLISALREEGLPFPRMQVEEREGTPALVALPLWRRALGFFA